jgi:general stress protein 26
MNKNTIEEALNLAISKWKETNSNISANEVFSFSTNVYYSSTQESYMAEVDFSENNNMTIYFYENTDNENVEKIFNGNKNCFDLFLIDIVIENIN